MAARLNPRHQDMVRQKIKASQLVNFVQNYALGKGEDQPNYQNAAVRVKAALGLLAKYLPDVQRTEWTGRDDGPINLSHTVVFIGASRAAGET